jgi:serine/threonine-protein kinase HipA
MNQLLDLAKINRKDRLLKLAQSTIKKAQQVWPEILNQAPVSVRDCILSRLQGGVSLTC